MVAVVWQFETVPDQGEEFERFYGADGEWTKLSLRSRSFLGSSFLKDLARPERYMLVEYWSEMLVYEKHLSDFDDEVKRLEEQRQKRFVERMEPSACSPRSTCPIASGRRGHDVPVEPAAVIESWDSRRAASSVVEHLTFNQGVPGSIPGRPTNPAFRPVTTFQGFSSRAPDTPRAIP